MNKIKKIFIACMLSLICLLFACSKDNSISIECAYSKIAVGESCEITIKSALDYTVTSSNENVAYYENGTLNGFTEGIAEIKADNGKEFASISVEVVKAKIEATGNVGLRIGDKLNLLDVFSSNYLTSFTYELGDTSLASITGNELVALGAGTTTLKAKLSQNNISLEKEITVTIKAAASKTNLSFSYELDELYVGEEINLHINNTEEEDTITYTSSDAAIIKVENDGTLKALSEGKAKVSATSSLTNYTLEKEIDVKAFTYKTEPEVLEAVYLGIDNYGNVTNSQLDSFVYKFSLDGETVKYTMKKVGKYELQNQLEEGNVYHLTVSNGQITDLTKLDNPVPFVDTDEAQIIEGTVIAISNYRIILEDGTFFFTEETKQYKINKKAGGATLSSATVKKDDFVRVSFEEDTCINIYQTTETPNYVSPVTPTPGEKTLANFLKTALSAVGVALYVYGGAWNFEDDGSSNQARSIGVADSWIEFFYEQTAYYNYKDSSKTASYYPFGAFNEYYYAGVDCSGYVGWVIYNVMNTEDGNEGYVMGSTKMAKTLASNGFGTYTRDFAQPTSAQSDWKVGDIMSMDGHVWICLGVCDDGSMVIMHSTPSASIRGISGGGAQLGAIGASQNCEAYQLADTYNKKYYPDWSSRYQTSLKNYSSYTSMSNANAGKFSWYLDERGLTDPDGFASMVPSEILKAIFGE